MAAGRYSLDDVLAHVLAGKRRRFRCTSCARQAEMFALLGAPGARYPKRCERCDPDNAVWVRQRELRPLYALVRLLHDRLHLARRGNAELRARVAVLERSSAVQVTARRANRYGDPTREALARAAVMVARAVDREAEREAALDVAAVATAYARSLEPGVDFEDLMAGAP